MRTMTALISRNRKLFFRDRGMFLSSLITPVILIVLYATFLANVYKDSFLSALPDTVQISDKLINGTVAAQLAAALLSVSCITVTFCVNLTMVQDLANGARKDFNVSPVKKSVIFLGYFLSTLLAEHVVHVDYSQKDFVVYLTEEGKLYGLGNDSTYMLLQHTEMPVEDLAYPTKRYVTSPALLLEDVSYARCGRDDVVALKKDGTVWTWGMIWNYQSTGYCITMPQQILTDVKMITGGWFNHAALKEDGTLCIPDC